MESADLKNIRDLFKGGYVEAAQHALEDVLRADPKDLQAWVMYVKSWKNPARRIKALELCLKYNPGNADAQSALDSLKSKMQAANQPTPAPRPVTPEPSQPSSSRQDDLPTWVAGLSAVGASTSSSLSSAPERLSKEEIDRQAREIEEEHRKQRLDVGRPMAWYEVWFTALTQPNVEAYDSLRLNPYALPSRTYLWLISAGLVSGLVGALSLGLNPQYKQAITLLEQSGKAQGLSQMFGAVLFCMVPLSGIVYLISTAISVGIMHLIAVAFGGRGKYSDFLYLVAAYSAPITIITTILGIIPFVGACLAFPLGIYAIGLNVQAVRSAHNFDSLRAIGVIVGVWLLSILIIGLILWSFYSAIAPYFPTYPTF
jgi:hypothetical protein